PPPLPPPLPPIRPVHSSPPLPALPPRSSHRGPIVLLGVVGIVFLCVVGYAALRVYRIRTLPAREMLTDAQKHQQTRVAFGTPGTGASDEEARAISTALNQLTTALQEHDSAGMTAVFDGDRYLQELERLATANSLSEAVKKEWIGYKR